MNNRKYWGLGIFAVLIALLIWYFAARGGVRPPEETGGHEAHGAASGQQESGADTPAQTGLSQYLADQDTIMATMMQRMNDVPRTENAAIDFLQGMLPHHEGALDMANSYLSNGGEHEALRALANDIVSAQTTEIAQMQEMLERLRSDAASADAGQSAAYWKAYEETVDHDHSAHASTDSLDAAFAAGMLSHHQMAIDMANAVLPNTGDEETRKLAQSIIDTQTAEIQQMQSILDALPQS